MIHLWFAVILFVASLAELLLARNMIFCPLLQFAILCLALKKMPFFYIVVAGLFLDFAYGRHFPLSLIAGAIAWGIAWIWRRNALRTSSFFLLLPAFLSFLPLWILSAILTFSSAGRILFHGLCGVAFSPVLLFFINLHYHWLKLSSDDKAR